jgi:hypothetical protein
VCLCCAVPAGAWRIRSETRLVHHQHCSLRAETMLTAVVELQASNTIQYTANNIFGSLLRTALCTKAIPCTRLLLSAQATTHMHFGCMHACICVGLHGKARRIQGATPEHWLLCSQHSRKVAYCRCMLVCRTSMGSCGSRHSCSPYAQASVLTF